MAKRIGVKKIRIALIVAAVLFLALCFSIPLLSKMRTPAVFGPEPAFAPAEYAYPDYFKDMPLDSGYSYRLSDDYMLTITDRDGKEYKITDTGQVYRLTEDGALSAVDASTANDILQVAAEAQSDSAAASSYFGGAAIIDKVDGTTLTDDQIVTIAGDKMDGDAFRTLAQKGMSISDIVGLSNADVDAQKAAQVYRPGMTLDDIVAAILHNDDINKALQEYLRGAGMSADEFKRQLEAMGLTPEQFLAGLSRMSSAPAPETPTVTPASAPRTVANTGSLPPISVSLGGSSGSRPTQSTGTSQSPYYPQSYDPAALAAALKTTTATTTTYKSINDQAGKKEFLAGFGGNVGEATFLTTNDLSAGTIISMTLKTGLNSDLPGQIVAEVDQNVYDTLTGTTLLIPKGTRMIATYDSSVSWGQSRALVAWTQLIRPDGLVLTLPGLPGIDGAGYAGYKDKVSNHWWQLIRDALLASVIDIGAGEFIQQASDADSNLIGGVVGDTAATLQTAGQKLIEKRLNRQPTLTIRPGRIIKLLVTQTLTLPTYRR